MSVRSGVLKDFEFPGKTGMGLEATCTVHIKCVSSRMVKLDVGFSFLFLSTIQLEPKKNILVSKYTHVLLEIYMIKSWTDSNTGWAKIHLSMI